MKSTTDAYEDVKYDPHVGPVYVICNQLRG